jgi:hypothetical protein
LRNGKQRTGLEVGERLADPVETATGRELLDERLVTVRDEDGIEESRATGLEGEVRVDDALGESVSALGTARAVKEERRVGKKGAKGKGKEGRRIEVSKLLKRRRTGQRTSKDPCGNR